MKRKNKAHEDSKRQLLLGVVLFTMLLLLVVFVPQKFFTLYNFRSMGSQLPELGLMAIAMLVVVITGGIDLSLTYTAALSGIVGAIVLVNRANAGMQVGFAIVLCILTMLAVAAVCGAFKGLLIAVLGVHPWLATLGMMTFLQGVSIIITNGGSISKLPKAFYRSIGDKLILGIPLVFIIMMVVLGGVAVLLHKTAWGQRLMLIGSNEKIARFTGIRVTRIKMMAYILSSVIAGLSGMVMVARYNSAKVDHGAAYLMQSITIIVLSGADINGGKANMLSMLLTLINMQVLYTGTSMLGGSRYTVVILNGLILIGILMVNAFLDKRTKHNEIKVMRTASGNM